jgi:AcrR family transcriptional regulator
MESNRGEHCAKDDVMQKQLPDVTHVLDVAAEIVASGGFETLTIASLAAAAKVSPEIITEMFGTLDEALVLMLNREFTRIYVSMVDNIERDPRGGQLSRIYYYTLTAVLERPLARALYTVDPGAMNSIMRSANSFGYVPGVGIRAELVETLQHVGMVRPETDASTLSNLLTVFSAGLAITAPHDDLDLIVRGMTDMLRQVVDIEVADTTPGKRAFYEWAMSLVETE